MLRSHRSRITSARLSGACALVACSALALAQDRPNVECKQTETQPECHARLKCKPNEELEECQKRLLRCRTNEELDACKKRTGADRAQEGNAGERGNADERGGGGEDRGGRDRGEGDEGGDRGDRGGRDEGDEGGRQGGEGRGDEGGRRRRGEGDEAWGGADKTFGLGLELGEPTGLNGKYFFSQRAALDFGIGWIYRHYYYDNGLHLYADFLYHPVSLVSASAFELPLYLGIGLRFWDFEYCFMGVCGYDGSAVGIRIPIGISFDFNEAPVDIFLQIVPVIDFLNDDYYDRYRDRNHFGVDASLGIRYWFM